MQRKVSIHTARFVFNACGVWSVSEAPAQLEGSYQPHVSNACVYQTPVSRMTSSSTLQVRRLLPSWDLHPNTVNTCSYNDAGCIPNVERLEGLRNCPGISAPCCFRSGPTVHVWWRAAKIRVVLQKISRMAWRSKQCGYGLGLGHACSNRRPAGCRLIFRTSQSQLDGMHSNMLCFMNVASRRAVIQVEGIKDG